jgi:hypothetical protein
VRPMRIVSQEPLGDWDVGCFEPDSVEATCSESRPQANLNYEPKQLLRPSANGPGRTADRSPSHRGGNADLPRAMFFDASPRLSLGRRAVVDHLTTSDVSRALEQPTC